MSDNINFDYKNLSPFKWFVLENFPFIEADFDALTEWQLFCKLGKEMNKIINSENTLGTQMENVTNAFIDLQNYVNNYFDNLDVQDEINNKLNEMVESGKLQEIVEEYFTEINRQILAQNEKITTQDRKIASQDEKIAQITSATPVFVNSVEDMEDTSTIYVLTTTGYIYVYNVTSEAFVNSGLLYSQNANSTTINFNRVQSSNYTTVLPDVNNLSGNNCYCLTFSSSDTNIPANLPVETLSGGNDLFIHNTFQTNSAFQRLILSNGNEFVRYKYNNNWNEWINISIYNFNNTINSSNYLTELPDLNNIGKKDVIYKLLFGANENSIPANLPIKPSGNVEILFNYKGNNTIVQHYFTNNNIFVRYKYNNSWTTWNSICDRKFYVGSGKQIRTIKEIVDFLNDNNIFDSTVYFDPEEYDLFNEFGGNDFFDNYNHSINGNGLVLQNRNKFIFSSNSKILFNYTGLNEEVLQYFSVFNSGSYGFTLDGANIECSKCRYAIHDERGNANVQYINIIKNCNIKIDNTSNNVWPSSRCIGGGLGRNGFVEIKNCLFNGISSLENTEVSYHNSVSGNAKNKVIIKDNYFINGGIDILYEGSSIEKTIFIISNNSVKDHITKKSNGTLTATIDNIDLYQFNNIIRQ